MQDVLARLRARDDASWRALHDAEFPILYRYGLALGADAALAEDAASEAFTRLVNKLPGLHLDSPAALRGWLIVVCRNYLRDHQRRRARISDAPIERHDRAAEDPDALMRLTLASALATLPGSQRDVLVMRFVLRMTSREIANASGRNVKAVESLQHRGLESLRKLPALKGVLA